MPEITTEAKPRPFSIGFVLRTTTKHMRKSIETSIRKTMERIPEFAGDRAKSEELFRTLAQLSAMKKNLDDFQNANPNDYQGA